jgi:methyl-accepting chemotaxis protein
MSNDTGNKESNLNDVSAQVAGLALDIKDVLKLVSDFAVNTDRRFEVISEQIEKLAVGTKNGFDEVHSRMDNFETRMDKFETRMDKFDTKLNNIERKVEDIDLRLVEQISYHEKEHAVIDDIIDNHNERIGVLEHRTVTA